jgi:transcriptional regulator with XRE-family HTH domain
MVFASKYHKDIVVSERAVKHVRKFLGQRLRALRKEHALSQERLGERSGLSGKFIGEVERGEKSISVDSLYRVATALEVPLRQLTDVQSNKSSHVPTPEAERIFALVAARRPAELRKAYEVLRAMFAGAR